MEIRMAVQSIKASRHIGDARIATGAFGSA
jgi:hypothetical protein